MNCPKCEGQTKVIDTAAVYDSVIRRRECLSCGQRFFTEELEALEEDQRRCSRLLYAKRRGEIV